MEDEPTSWRCRVDIFGQGTGIRAPNHNATVPSSLPSLLTPPRGRVLFRA